MTEQKLQKFEVLRRRAEERKGGAAELASLLPGSTAPEQLSAISDDRCLAALTKVINQAGFSWKVIENKWPQFEEAFFSFDPHKLKLLSPEQWEAYTSDRRIVRNWQKISALRDNVGFVLLESGRHGSFGHFLAGWPETDQIGLMAYLKKHGSRLGGNSALYFLRHVGKDCFIPGRDVVKALQEAGLAISDSPTSKRDLTRIQDAFNQWHRETQLPFSHLSRIAACSTGENYARL